MTRTYLIVAVLIFGIGAAILSIAVLFGQPGTLTSGARVIVAPGSDAEYVIRSGLPVQNSSCPVYRATQPRAPAEYFELLSRQYDLQGVASPLSPGITVYRDSRKMPDRRIELYENSGGYRYSVPDKMTRSVDYQPVLPSIADAKIIADKYLEERGLLPEHAGFSEASVVSSQSEWDAGFSEPVKKYDILIGVVYLQQIHELPAVGGSLTVYIGENGEVAGVTNKMRTLEEEPVKTVTMISPERALEHLSGKKYVVEPWEDDYGTFVITNVSLAYWIEPLTAKQEFVYPVYVFSGTADGQGKVNTITRYIWAVPDNERS